MAEPSAGDDSSGGTSKPESVHVHTAEELAAMSGPDSLAPLSYTLAHVVGVEEEELVSGLRQTDVVQRAVEMAKEQLSMPKEEVTAYGQDVLCKVFGGLVNLACIGGVELVKEQDGLDLMIDGMRADLYAVRYFAVAGLQNMCGQDYECAWRVVQTNSEPLLHELLKTSGEDEQMKRVVVGALANIDVAKQQSAPPTVPKPKTRRERKAAEAAAAERVRKDKEVAAMLAAEVEARRQQDRIDRFREWHFAKVIEKHVLRAIGRARRKLAAATLIAAAARGMPARREARVLRHELRQQLMATRTQAAVRGMPARKEARHLRQERGATRLQSARRGQLARHERAERTQQRGAATLVQARVRARPARAELARSRQAATLMAASARGGAARREYAGQRAAVTKVAAHVRGVQRRACYTQERAAATTVAARVKGAAGRREYAGQRAAVTRVAAHVRARPARAELAQARRAAAVLAGGERGRKQRAVWARQRWAVSQLERRARVHVAVTMLRRVKAGVLHIQAAARRRAATLERWRRFVRARGGRMRAIELGMHAPPPTRAADRKEAHVHVAQAYELWQELHAPPPPWHARSAVLAEMEGRPPPPRGPPSPQSPQSPPLGRTAGGSPLRSRASTAIVAQTAAASAGDANALVAAQANRLELLSRSSRRR